MKCKKSAMNIGVGVLVFTIGAVSGWLGAQGAGGLSVLLGSVVAAGAIAGGFSLNSLFFGDLSGAMTEFFRNVRDRFDLTSRLDKGKMPEAGMLPQMVNDWLEKLHLVIKDIGNNSSTMQGAASVLHDTTEDMARQADAMRMESTTVAAAGEELTSNVRTMAAASEEISTSVRDAAAAVEEMSTSIAEVAANCQKEAQVAKEANDVSVETMQVVQGLGDSAVEIAKVVDLISDIADRTNLLSLNATIEAASAGEAGRSFAVVAHEVKELARQSGSAAREIKEKVSTVQGRTDSAVKSMRRLNEIISEVDSISTTISAAAEEQAATSREMAGTMEAISEATSELTRNVEECATASNDVSSSVLNMSQKIRESAGSTKLASANVSDLISVSQKLNDLVSQFQLRKATFQIADVKNAHLQWAVKLSGVLSGAIDMHASDVTHSTQCVFGKWFYGKEGKTLSSNPHYREVEKWHNQVHELAKHIVEEYNADRRSEAQRLYDEFEKARKGLFDELDALYLTSEV